MRKSLQQQESYNILPEYGKRRLLLYADTLLEIADSFEDRDEIKIQETGGQDGIQLFLMQNRREQNLLLADQLSETANTLKALANETYATSAFLERMKRKVEKGLWDNDLLIKELYVIELDNHLEIGMMISAKKEEMFYTDELAEYLSELCHCKLCQHDMNPSYVYDEPKLLIFEEEVNFFALHGVARAKKENENSSGDAYLIKELSRGIFLVGISDGMGSGEEAAQDSEKIMDLLDKFSETGFHIDKAGALLNSLACLHEKDEHTVTLDTCEVDLYQGTCRFLKYGAGASFIKRGKHIWKVSGESLPLGVFSKEEPDESAYGLEDGDYIIMMTDGVIDSLATDYVLDGELSSLKDYLADLSCENPRQMAVSIINQAITCAHGHIMDDMTVIVFGIFANR